jgi:hypothetical protein
MGKSTYVRLPEGKYDEGKYDEHVGWLGKVWDNVVKHGTMWQSMTNQHVVPFKNGSICPISMVPSSDLSVEWSAMHWENKPPILTMWGLPVISWFINTSKYSYKYVYHKP